MSTLLEDLEIYEERLGNYKIIMRKSKDNFQRAERRADETKAHIERVKDLIAKGGRFEHKTGQSSVIKSFEFNSYPCQPSKLSVEFNDGSIYHYGGVTRKIYEGMRDTPSVGYFFVKEVKGRYDHEKEGL